MSRYQNALQTPGAAESYLPAINQYMVNEGFEPITYKGQQVWKKGLGIATAPQYISIYYRENTIYLEAFIRFALFPGLYVGEMGINGFIGALPKSLLKGRVEAIENYIKALWQQPAGGQAG